MVPDPGTAAVCLQDWVIDVNPLVAAHTRISHVRHQMDGSKPPLHCSCWTQKRLHPVVWFSHRRHSFTIHCAVLCPLTALQQRRSQLIGSVQDQTLLMSPGIRCLEGDQIFDWRGYTPCILPFRCRWKVWCGRERCASKAGLVSLQPFNNLSDVVDSQQVLSPSEQPFTCTILLFYFKGPFM